MTEKEFLEKVKKTGVRLCSLDGWHVIPVRDKEPAEMNHHLSSEWYVGGMSGGSCWNTGDEELTWSSSGLSEPDFDDLDKVIETILPDISYMKYRKLVSGIIQYSERSENEYYGNTSEYKIKRVRLGDLYKRMVELELV